MTECASTVFANPQDPARRRYGSPGVPCGVEAKVVDAQGRELGVGEAGEILLRGPNVMQCYYKAPELTAFTGLRVGLATAKALARELAIPIAGVATSEALLEAAAVGVPDPDYGQEIFAFVVLKPGQQCSEAELRGFCLKELGKYKTPKRIRLLDELPKGPSGKVQRLKLAAVAGGAG